MHITNNGILKKAEEQDVTNGILTIPDGVTTIGSFSIENVYSLREIVIPPSVKLIQAYSVRGHGPTQVVVPSTVSKVMDRAFEGALDLTALTFSPNTDFTEKAFYWCPNLQKLKVGFVNYMIRCLELGAPYIISSKQEYSSYKLYSCIEYRRDGKEGEKFYCAQKDSVLGSGSTPQRAIKDCEKKIAFSDVKKAYVDMTLDTFIDSIDVRRIIGASDREVVTWMSTHGYAEDTILSAREMLEIIEGKDYKMIFAQFIADRYADRTRRKE